MYTHYIFIDGASFESAISEICIDVIGVAELKDVISFERIASDYSRLFYYDSLPARKDKQEELNFLDLINKKEELFDIINETDCCHVHSAMSRYRKKRGQEQKGVDILLAIDVLQHAYRGNIESATIVTSDLDFLPLFDALSQTRVRSHLFYRPKFAPKELVQSADFAGTIHCNKLLNWCHPKMSNKFRVEVSQMGSIQKLSWADEFEINKEIFYRGRFQDSKLSSFVILFSKAEYEKIGEKCRVYSSENERAIIRHIGEEAHIRHMAS